MTSTAPADQVRREMQTGSGVPVAVVRSLSGLGRKRNAHQFGSTYAGRFEINPYGEAMLFVDATKPPYVLVRSADGVLLFDARDSAATTAVFDSLTALRTAR